MQKSEAKTITASCTKGRLYTGLYTHAKVYGSYELKVYNSSGKLIASSDVYNGSGKVSFKAEKGQSYTIKAWVWKASTTAKSYINHGIMKWSPFERQSTKSFDDAHWSTDEAPTLTIKY